MNDWIILKNDKIIDLLIGDEVIIEEIFNNYTMPYMKKNDIIEFGKILGCNFKDESISRKNLMAELIEQIVDKGTINIFFKELLKLKRFRGIKDSFIYKTIDELYNAILYKLFEKINKELHFDGYRLDYNFKNWQFSLVEEETEIRIEIDDISEVNKDYIQRLINEIENTILNKDYESTITKSRTLLEEVMIYGIEEKQQIPTGKGNIKNTYNQFKTLYNMHQDSSMDKRIKDLLSGLEKIVNSISDMRNYNSDSHGVVGKRINVEEHHARLAANSSITMANFLLAVINKLKKK